MNKEVCKECNKTIKIDPPCTTCGVSENVGTIDNQIMIWIQSLMAEMRFFKKQAIQVSYYSLLMQSAFYIIYDQTRANYILFYAISILIAVFAIVFLFTLNSSSVKVRIRIKQAVGKTSNDFKKYIFL